MMLALLAPRGGDARQPGRMHPSMFRSPARMNRNTGKVGAAPRALQIGMTIALSLAVLALPGCASKSRGGNDGMSSTTRSGSDRQTDAITGGDSGSSASGAGQGGASRG